MAMGTLGGVDVTGRVESTIYRRGAEGSPMARFWTVLGAAGGVLAIVAMFVTWYAAVRTASGINSGWMPPIGLALVIVAAAILVLKSTGRIAGDVRVPAEGFSFALFAGTGLVLMARQLTSGDLHPIVFLAVIPILAWAPGAITQWSPNGGKGAARLELEQVALTLAVGGGGVIIVKRILDWEHATGGWLWGLLAAIAVSAAAFLAARALGIISGFQVTLFAALAISTIILIVLLVQVIGDGWPMLSERFGDFWGGTLRSRSDDDRLGISQGIAGSFWIAVFVTLLAFPIGVAAAVYLEEYAPRQVDATEHRPLHRFLNAVMVRITLVLDITVRNLAGVPSVVYGLLGLFLFVKGNVVINWFVDRINNVWAGVYDDQVLIETGQSTLFAGGVTLAILVLPIVIITAAEAIRAVPQSLREGAYGVGGTKWQVIKSQVLPFAAPGILTGTLLSLARAVGEAAPLILVGAITGRLAPRDSMFSGFEEFFSQFADRFTAMPIVIVGWVQNSGRDAGFGPAAGAAIVVLLVFVILMNSIAVLLRNRFEKKRA